MTPLANAAVSVKTGRHTSLGPEVRGGPLLQLLTRFLASGGPRLWRGGQAGDQVHLPAGSQELSAGVEVLGGGGVKGVIQCVSVSLAS